MAMRCVLTQPKSAIMGQPCVFVLACTNTTGGTLNIETVSPYVKGTDGLLSPGVNVGPIVVAAGQSTAQVGGSQFNVQVTSAATVYFTFSVSFFGQSVGGSGAVSDGQFMVGADVSDSAPSVSTAPPLTVAMNMPQFGQAPGAPPNPTPTVTSLNFSTPANSAFAL